MVGAVLAGTGVAASSGFGGELRHAAAAPAIETSVVRTATPASNEPSINQGYWLEARDGGIFPFGAAGGFGSLGGAPLNQPVVGMTATPDGGGYWMVAADGGVFPFGNAGGFGSTGNIALNQPMVAMASTADGNGYWLVARDGGVFPFGNAIGYGSTGNIHLNQPIVGMAATPDGRGYWLVASDGGIFPFGDAGGYGSTGGIHLNQSITNMTSTKDGKGYWLCARDGGIFPFGDAAGYGSTGGVHLNRPIVAMAGTPSGQGYWLGATDGGIFPFGDAQGLGSWANHRLNAPIIATVAAPPIGLISLGGGGPITADQGAAGVPIIFELTRAGGSVVKNATIVFSLSGLSHGTLSAPSAVTGSDGKVTVIFKDTFPGDTGTVFASVKNTGSKTAAPLITVSQGVPSGLAIVPNQPAQVSADGSPIIATVTDSAGNPIPNLAINFAAKGFAHTETVNPTSAPTNSAGQATTTLIQGFAGDTGVVTVSIASGPSGQTAQLTVVNGAPSGIVVVGNQPAASYTANLGANPGIPVTFQLQDINHNPVPNVQVTATGPPHATFGGLGNPQTTASNGQVTFTLLDTFAKGNGGNPANAADTGPISAVAATGQSGATTSFTIFPGPYHHIAPLTAFSGAAETAGAPSATFANTLQSFDGFTNLVDPAGAATSSGATDAAPSGTVGSVVVSPSATPGLPNVAFTPYKAQAGASLTITIGLSSAVVGSGITVNPSAYNNYMLASPPGLPASQTAGATGTATLNTFDLYKNAQSASGHIFSNTGSTMLASAPNNGATVGSVTFGAPGPVSTGISFVGYKAGPASVVVDGLTVGSVTINPGPMGAFTVTCTPACPSNTITMAASSVSQSVTITLSGDADAYGNTGPSPVAFTLNGTDVGALSGSPVTIGVNGGGSFTYISSSNAATGRAGSITNGAGFPTITVND